MDPRLRRGDGARVQRGAEALGKPTRREMDDSRRRARGQRWGSGVGSLALSPDNQTPDNAMTHALILAGAPLAKGAESVATDILAAFDATPTDGRSLSAGRASELSVEGIGDRAATISAALREALPEIDIAILPAENRRKKLLCADMDATIVVGETIDELADALGKKTEVAAITERAMRGELDFEQALDERVAMLRGLDASEIDRIAATLTYSPGAAELVATMRAHGAECVLVSGGFDRVTGVVRETLGFSMDVANHLEVGSDGCLTGTARKPVVGADKKLETLLERVKTLRLSQDECVSIGDGANDLPMIEAAGLGIAYRGKPALRAATDVHINHTDLRTVLYFQGYSDADIV